MAFGASNISLGAATGLQVGDAYGGGIVFWLDGKRGIAIGLFVPVNQLNVVEFGKRLKKIMGELASNYPKVDLKPLFFQPDRVESRISELGQSLLMGMLLVSLVLTFFLGFRPGIVVASVIPLELSLL